MPDIISLKRTPNLNRPVTQLPPCFLSPPCNIPMFPFYFQMHKRNCRLLFYRTFEILLPAIVVTFGSNELIKILCRMFLTLTIASMHSGQRPHSQLYRIWPEPSLQPYLSSPAGSSHSCWLSAPPQHQSGSHLPFSSPR